MKREETSEHILVDIISSRIESDVLSSFLGHHIERGCESIYPLVDIMVAIAIMAQGCIQKKREQPHQTLE